MAASTRLRPEPRHAFAGAHHARRRHLRALDFLDLAGRAGAVIDHHALAEPEVDDVLLPRDDLGARAVCACKQDEGGKGEGGPHHLFWIFRPSGPTLICNPSGCFFAWYRLKLSTPTATSSTPMTR